MKGEAGYIVWAYVVAAVVIAAVIAGVWLDYRAQRRMLARLELVSDLRPEQRSDVPEETVG